MFVHNDRCCTSGLVYALNIIGGVLYSNFIWTCSDFFYFFFGLKLSTSSDPDQKTHSVPSDLGLHCLPEFERDKEKYG